METQERMADSNTRDQEVAQKYWGIAELLDTKATSGEAPRRLVSIVLNRPLSDVGFEIVQRSEIVICADGGATRLESMIQRQVGEMGPESYLALLPSVLDKKFLVVGDFDSIHSETLQRLKKLGDSVNVLLFEDQDSTDLEKSIRALKSVLLRKNSPSLDGSERTNVNSSHSPIDPTTIPVDVAVVGAFGGSLHHVLANLHVLFRSIDARLEVSPESKMVDHLSSGQMDDILDDYSFLKAPSTQLYLTGEGSICCLLAPGRHRLRVDSNRSREMCGLLPLGNSVRSISTSGLQWNLNSSEMKFGGLISSSNRVVSPVVEVSTSDPVLFTLDINEAVERSESGAADAVNQCHFLNKIAAERS